ncbi:MAG: flippase-like domain-containing protein, partial [Planctomycetes bacterium]|nr:flippase-like domain-containing protein [Planctomycetota bacterium]
LWTLAAAAGVIALGGVTILFAPRALQARIERAAARLPGGRFLARLAAAIWQLRTQKRALLIALFLSVVTQAGIVVTHMIVARALIGEYPRADQYFFLIPVGQLGFALPVSPGGLGVAEWAYKALFSSMGATHGAEVALCYRILMAICAAWGIYFYVRGKKALEEAARATEEMNREPEPVESAYAQGNPSMKSTSNEGAQG